MNIGQYPDPTHRILHLSDTHLVEHRRPLYGQIDSDANVSRLLARLVETDTPLDAIVLTGDLADGGAPDAYDRLRALIEPFAADRGCDVVWVMGNHDNREAFRERLLDEPATDESVDRVFHLNGLRIIALDSTVPGVHHGELAAEQLAWLAHELESPAEHGTLLALHHPPVPTHLPLLQMVELRDTSPFAEVVRGSDVRGILAGHFHYSTHTMFAGVPVSVAAASCYTQDAVVPLGGTRAQNLGQGANLVHVYHEQVVHSQLSLDGGDTVYEVTPQQAQDWVRAAAAGEPIAAELLNS